MKEGYRRYKDFQYIICIQLDNHTYLRKEHSEIHRGSPTRLRFDSEYSCHTLVHSEYSPLVGGSDELTKGEDLRPKAPSGKGCLDSREVIQARLNEAKW